MDDRDGVAGDDVAYKQKQMIDALVADGFLDLTALTTTDGNSVTEFVADRAWAQPGYSQLILPDRFFRLLCQELGQARLGSQIAFVEVGSAYQRRSARGFIVTLDGLYVSVTCPRLFDLRPTSGR